ncbi:MAG TPA: DinB family protein [Vicinamibacterales bacterium]|nr:DinB family protein [Vicinamibacterales bacterium]
MTHLTPDNVTVVLQTLLPALDREHPTTKRVIEAIPDAKVDYTPDSISMSAINLAWHIVTTEHRFLSAVNNGAFDLTPMPKPDSVRTASDVNRWYAKNYADDVAALQALSADKLVKIVDFRGMMQLPAIAYVDFALRHSIHHRGQLSMYLRPMGAKVPSIYGESYDARQAREAAQGKA